MRNLKHFLAFLPVLFSIYACTAITKKKDSGNTALTYIQCVDNAMTIGLDHFATTKGRLPNSEDLVDAAMEVCQPQFEIFISNVIARTKQKNGWGSLHPKVKPNLEEHYKNQFREQFLEATTIIRVKKA